MQIEQRLSQRRKVLLYEMITGMALQRDSKLGYGFLLVGAGLPYLADKLFGPIVSLVIVAITFIVGIVFLLAAHHERLAIRRSLVMTIWVFTLYGAGIGALGGGIAGFIAHLRANAAITEEEKKAEQPIPPAAVEKSEDHSMSVTDKAAPAPNYSRPHTPSSAPKHLDEQPTLYSLFKHDFDSTVRFAGPFSIKEKGTDKTVIEFDAQIYFDIPARSKFVGVYFLHTTPEETVKKCVLFANFYQGILDMQMPEATSAFVGEEMMSSRDLIFSGRVYIYHEDYLSLEQRASLEILYRSKNLSVQFRGPDYLSGKILAWSASRKQ